MSRNLHTTACRYCSHEPVLVEEPRPITPEEAGRAYREYAGMTVAHAECPMCLAKYLAWVEPPPGHSRTDGSRDARPFYDLSFRSSFDDEPGDEDLPVYEVECKRVWRRVGPFTSTH